MGSRLRASGDHPPGYTSRPSAGGTSTISFAPSSCTNTFSKLSVCGKLCDTLGAPSAPGTSPASSRTPPPPASRRRASIDAPVEPSSSPSTSPSTRQSHTFRRASSSNGSKKSAKSKCGTSPKSASGMSASARYARERLGAFVSGFISSSSRNAPSVVSSFLHPGTKSAKRPSALRSTETTASPATARRYASPSGPTHRSRAGS